MENIIELLLQAVKEVPELVLFSDSEKEVTYAKALCRVKSIALYLKKKKIVHQPILVPVDRNVETPLLFLGIAASSNYYVPIDKGAKEERWKDRIERGSIRYGFTSREGLLSLSFSEAREINPSANEFNALAEEYRKEEPLYLRFTSGSTGKPKGVLKSHENVLSFAENFRKTFPEIPDGQRIANQTPFFFDASAKDIYLTLKLKGTLFIPPKEAFVLPNKSVEYLNEKKITRIRWVPSALILIARLRVLAFVKPLYLRYVFFIGEVFPVKYFNSWITYLPDVRYVNWYGSTEIAGACLCARLTHPYPEDKPLPLGKPLFGNDVRLVDGEIVVSSKQVALGYLHDEERNRKTFVPANDGSTLLHTGDFGHYDEKGNIIFSSRKDFQIKHLGYRIELQDIEAHAMELSYRSACCCLYKKDKIILIACLNKGIDKTIGEVKTDLSKVLADYRRPSKIVFLDSLPLNGNGKIDRTLLEHERTD